MRQDDHWRGHFRHAIGKQHRRGGALDDHECTLRGDEDLSQHPQRQGVGGAGRRHARDLERWRGWFPVDPPRLSFVRTEGRLQVEIFRIFQVVEDLTDDPPDEGHVAILQLPLRRRRDRRERAGTRI